MLFRYLSEKFKKTLFRRNNAHVCGAWLNDKCGYLVAVFLKKLFYRSSVIVFCKKRVPCTAVPVNTAVPVQQEPLPTGIPTQVRAYSVNDLAIACRPLMEAGKQPELQALLAEFGAPAGLASVPENRRAEFAGRLRQMGGQI